MSKNENPDWIDELFSQLGQDTSLDEESALPLKNMQSELFEELFFQPDGKTISIQKILEGLTNKYESRFLPLDPSECLSSCINVEFNIASSLQNVKDGKILYHNTKQGKVLLPNRNILYNMWTEHEAVHTEQGVKHIPYGRITASDEQYILAIDRHFSKNEHFQYQLMLLGKSEPESDYIHSALFIDLLHGYKPYQNVVIFSDEDTLPSYANAYNLRNVCNSFINLGSSGNLPSPEFV